jgi:hypothetical protein
MKDSVFSIFISFFNFFMGGSMMYMHMCTMPYNPNMAATNLINYTKNKIKLILIIYIRLELCVFVLGGG